MFPTTIKTLRKKKPVRLSDHLQSLNPFLDKDGLLRVGGRLSQSMKAYESRHPLIIRGKHHLSTLIVQSEHKRLCHAGPKLTLGSLQDTYHIVAARRVVRKCIRGCVICKRASPKISTQLMGQLPSARVLPTFANERVSVDYAGPFTLKVGSVRKPTYRKAYIAIFVCLVTESCHIEFVSDLSAEAFLATLRRFVSRRGKPTQIWSDNATYFRRTDKDLKELYRFWSIGRPLEALPSPVHTESVLGLKRWKLCQALTQHFWKRWSAEYLTGLQRFNKWKFRKQSLQVNDIVLIRDNRAAPCQWPLGRVTKVHPGPDNLVRVVTVQMNTGTFIRPIVKLCLLLPAKEEPKKVDQTCEETLNNES